MADLHCDDVIWVVNSIGELGVKIGDRFFFCYKGGSLEYTTESDDGEPLKWRRVGKREFGETVAPLCVVDGRVGRDPYTVELRPGIAPLDPLDQWQLLPLAEPDHG